MSHPSSNPSGHIAQRLHNELNSASVPRLSVACVSPPVSGSFELVIADLPRRMYSDTDKSRASPPLHCP